MSNISDIISTPSNVITLNRSGDVTGDQKIVMNLLRDGSMVMIGRDITRFDPDTLEFVKFDLYGSRGPRDTRSKLWTPGRSVDLNSESTDSVLFVKCTDLFYGQHHHILFVKNDEGWFEFKFATSNKPNDLNPPETPLQFIKLSDEGEMYLVRNIVTNKLAGIAFGDTPLLG
jgi:hypothetical protein